VQRETDHFVQEWLESIGEGVPGYVTPKVAVGAIVGNDAGEILLVQRKDSGIWLYPTGWADVGYSPAEVAVKEVSEETGHRVRAGPSARRHRRPADGVQPLRHVHAAVPLPSPPAASCDRTRSRPPTSAGSPPTRCPRRPPGAQWWGPMAFEAIDGVDAPATFDSVRSPVWRND
jgi:8-oxo-dGTP pyrophosphatase MutT (NUDIX family)